MRFAPTLKEVQLLRDIFLEKLELFGLIAQVKKIINTEIKGYDADIFGNKYNITGEENKLITKLLPAEQSNDVNFLKRLGWYKDRNDDSYKIFHSHVDDNIMEGDVFEVEFNPYDSSQKALYQVQNIYSQLYFNNVIYVILRCVPYRTKH